MQKTMKRVQTSTGSGTDEGGGFRRRAILLWRAAASTALPLTNSELTGDVGREEHEGAATLTNQTNF